MAKIQRIHPLPSANRVIAILKHHHVKRAVVEASEYENSTTFQQWCKELKKHVRIISSPYLPSKTIRIDLSQSEEDIFQQFTEAKRRAVRRAMKHTLRVTESQEVDQLIRVKNKSAGFLGFITTHGLKALWNAFGNDHTTCILVYTSTNTLVAGVFLIFWDDIAYYWIAGGTKQGKKLFAPTLAAWEAIKCAKQKGMKHFDWVGVWDERFPKDNVEWKGFTKFKEGFGGTALYYPTHRD